MKDRKGSVIWGGRRDRTRLVKVVRLSKLGSTTNGITVYRVKVVA